MRTFTLEELVLLDLDEAVAIAGRTAVGARLAVPRQADAHAVVDAAGDCDVELRAVLHMPATAAVSARISDDGAGALTGRTRRLHAKDAGRLNDLPVAVTIAASGPLRS